MLQFQQVGENISSSKATADNPVNWIAKQERKSNFCLDGSIINSFTFGKLAIARDVLLHFRKHTERKVKLANFLFYKIVEKKQRSNKGLADIKGKSITHKGVCNIGEEMKDAYFFQTCFVKALAKYFLPEIHSLR